MGGWPGRSAGGEAPPLLLLLEGEGTLSGPWHCCLWGGQWSLGPPFGCLSGQCTWHGPGAMRRPVCLQQRDPEDSEGEEGGSCRRWVGRTSSCGPEGLWEQTRGVPGGAPWGRALDRTRGSGRGNQRAGAAGDAVGLGGPGGERGTWVLDKRNKPHPV